MSSAPENIGSAHQCRLTAASRKSVIKKVAVRHCSRQTQGAAFCRHGRWKEWKMMKCPLSVSDQQRPGRLMLRRHTALLYGSSALGRECACAGVTSQGVCRRQQTSRSPQMDRETSRGTVPSSERLVFHSQGQKGQSPAGCLVHTVRQQGTSLCYPTIQLAMSLKIPEAPCSIRGGIQRLLYR